MEESHSGLEWHDGEEMMTIFIFAWAIPLNLKSLGDRQYEIINYNE